MKHYLSYRNGFCSQADVGESQMYHTTLRLQRQSPGLDPKTFQTEQLAPAQAWGSVHHVFSFLWWPPFIKGRDAGSHRLPAGADGSIREMSVIHSWQQKAHVGPAHTGPNRFLILISLQEWSSRSDFAVRVRSTSPQLPGSHNTQCLLPQ